MMRRLAVVGASLAALFLAPVAWARGEGPQGGMEERIDRLLTATFRPDQPGAAVIVVRGDSVIFRRGYGLADLELGVPVRPEMVFRIGSETKSFTAAAVMVLAQRGSLALDDPIRRHLPDLPARFDSVSIRQLLSHTAGVPDMFARPYYELQERRFHALVNDEVAIDEFLDLVVRRDLDFAPGSAFRYSNGGYFILGRLIERVSGMEYPRFLSEAVLGPLLLRSTRYYSNTALVPGRVPGYLDDDSAFIRNPYGSLPGSILYAAGGLLSSVDDLARFHLGLHRGDLLNPASRAEMFTPQTRGLMSGATQYGLGFFLGRLRGRTVYWHGGDAYGFHTSSYFLPGERVYVAILTNNPRMPTRRLDPVAKRIAAIAVGDPFPEWTPITLDAARLARLAGAYRISATSVRSVVVDGTRIYTQRDGGSRQEILAASADTFFYPSSLSYITFQSNARGSVERMVMHLETGEEEVARKER